MLKSLRVLLPAAVALNAAVCSAGQVQSVDLYSVVMPIESRSESQRNSQAQSALKHIFIRISGDPHVVDNYPGLQNYISKAGRYIASYQYQLEPVVVVEPIGWMLSSEIADEDTSIAAPDAGSPNAAISSGVGESSQPPGNTAVQPPQLQVQLTFNQASVRGALRLAGAPYWQAKRPVVWAILVQQQNGVRQFVQPETSPVLKEALHEHAALRGLPLIFPIDELASLDLNADNIGSLEPAQLIEAAQSFDIDIVLLGKVSQIYAFTWLGQWKSYEGSLLNEQFIDVDSAQKVALAGIEPLFSRLGAQFGVGLGADLESNRYLLTIDNIATQNDYLAMITSLEKIDGFTNIKMLGIIDKRCQFSIEFTGTLGKAQGLLALNKHFYPTGDDQSLTFEWHR
jgi:hypothetical protein